jgi:serine protease Do
LILGLLLAAAVLVYGAPMLAERSGYAWESGRARAAAKELARLDGQGAVSQASSLFRLATTAVSPAVVNVQSFRGGGGLGPHGLPLGGASGNREAPASELGSGVVVDRVNGYVVTNHHVVEGADRIVVRLGPRHDVPAKLVGADPKTDLAVLQVKADLKIQAEWGDSDKLAIGDWVLAIGSPLGFDHSVTAGIVSATERNDLRIAEYESFIQTDAAINPGNSGGPLIDLAGKVIGINTAIITQSGGYEGIGLAIPSSLARRIVEDLIKNGKVVRGYLGVAILPVDDELVKSLKLPENRGVLITSVLPDGPAGAAKLKAGDVIVKLAGRNVDDPTSLRYVTAELGAGVQVPLVYYRDGDERTADVTIARVPTNPQIEPFGFWVREVPGGPGGKATVVEVDRVAPGSPAYTAGLRPGMAVMAVDKTPVQSALQLLSIARGYDPTRGLPLMIMARDGRYGPVVLTAPAPASARDADPAPPPP